MKTEIYEAYLKILKYELVPAFGCTEPVSIAYGAAKASEILGEMPQNVIVEASGNIIKNVKSVVIPNTDGLKGLEAAVAAGIVAGKADKVLEVISEVTNRQREEIRDFLNRKCIHLKLAESDFLFDLVITVYSKESYAKVRISHSHTNIVLLEKDGKILFEKEMEEIHSEIVEDKKLLNVEDIITFANEVSIEDVKEILDCQIQFNTAICEEGLKNSYGANIGKVILDTYGSDDVKVRAKAKAAAGSDARMSGCELPVVINSGSGNQGITVSVPVIEFARELQVSEETLYRALVISNLTAIHTKTGIGVLSAYCGAVSAGCAGGAGIAYLFGGSYREIAHTIVNSLAITSGIVCDGAKPSCAAKISTAIEAGIFGYYMFKENQQFRGGDGIVKKGVEETIRSVGKLGKIGMLETDKEILKIMIS